MAVDVEWNSVETTEVLPGAPVQATDGEGKKLLGNLNALDEALADRTCPGASSQTFFGHDHGEEGGGPIIRGCVWCADGGSDPIKVFDPTDASRQTLRLDLSGASPGLNPDGRQMYRVDIKYKAISAKWRVTFNGGPEVQLEEFEESEKPRWVSVFGAIPSRDWLVGTNAFELWSESNHDAAEFHIYAIVIWETYENSQYHGGPIDIPRLAGSYDTYSYPNAVLDGILVEDGDSMDALTFADSVMRLNAIYEHTMDRPALGSSTQRIQGHDHYSSGYGGRSVPMSCIYSTRTYDLSGSAELYTILCTTQNTWYYFDQTATARRTTASSTPGGTQTTHPMFLAYVSQGFTSSGSPPSSQPYLVGLVYIRHAVNPSEIFEVRLYNINTGAYSAATVGVGASEEGVFIDKIPCVGGVINRFAIEIRCATNNSIEVDMLGCHLFEVGSYSGTNRTYDGSSGSAPLAVANSFRR